MILSALPSSAVLIGYARMLFRNSIGCQLIDGRSQQNKGWDLSLLCSLNLLSVVDNRKWLAAGVAVTNRHSLPALSSDEEVEKALCFARLAVWQGFVRCLELGDQCYSGVKVDGAIPPCWPAVLGRWGAG